MKTSKLIVVTIFSLVLIASFAVAGSKKVIPTPSSVAEFKIQILRFDFDKAEDGDFERLCLEAYDQPDQDASGKSTHLGKLENMLILLKTDFDHSDPKFDPNTDLGPPTQIQPPDPNLQPGADVADVKDPVLRKQYQASIDENAKRLKYWSRQYELWDMKACLLRDTAAFIQQNFTKADGEDLKNLVGAVWDGSPVPDTITTALIIK